MTKYELLKKLEYLIAFQSDCLVSGNWDEFDKAENEIKRIEGLILAEK
jgi:hypothetical protein